VEQQEVADIKNKNLNYGFEKNIKNADGLDFFYINTIFR
jgi:hypothetical protein